MHPREGPRSPEHGLKPAAGAGGPAPAGQGARAEQPARATPERPSPTDVLWRVLSEHGSPVLVYDLAVLRARATALRAALPPAARLLYSLKANPLPPLVAALQAAGCGSEVSSLGELAVALGATRQAGSPGSPGSPEPPRLPGPAGPVLFTGPGKSDAELTAALAAGALLSCESATEVARVGGLARAADRIPVVLRVQPDERPPAGLSMSDGRQFGLLPDDAVALCRQPPAGVEVVGFHCYLGSQLPDVAALLTGFEHTLATVSRIARAGGVRPRVLDLGGGFPWPYAAAGTGPELTGLGPALAELLAPVQADGTEVWFESGRGLVAAAGRLLTTVRDVKQRGERTVIVVDAGVNVLGGMSGLGRVLRPSTALRNLTAPDGEPRTVDVVGPLCTPLDRLAVATTVAEPHPGDVLCVANVGAYATTAALTAFLSRPAAAEVVVDGERVLAAWALRTGHEPVAPAATRNPR